MISSCDFLVFHPNASGGMNEAFYRFSFYIFYHEPSRALSEKTVLPEKLYGEHLRINVQMLGAQRLDLLN